MDSHRDIVLNTLDIYASNNTSALFAKAIRLLGYPGSAADRTDIDLIVDSADIVNVDMNRIPHSIDGPKLYPHVRSAIAEYKSKPSELEFFICDVITKFKDISAYVYPASKPGGYDSQIQAFSLLASIDHYNPADSVLNEWKKYEAYCNPKLTEEQLQEAVQYRLELFHKYMGGPVHGRVHSIIEDMKTVASLIDAALLENGLDKDYFSYQQDAKCILTYELDTYDISENSGVNPDRIKDKLFVRTFYYDVPPCGLLIPELRDQIAEYRNTGVWNMTRKSYIKVIAAPDDVRKANLSDYLTRYHRYVYTLNEEGSIRELFVVFYGLFEQWQELRFFEDNNTFAPHPCREIVKLFHQQLVHHIAMAYFVYLVTDEDAWYDIYTLYPGLKHKEIEDYLCEENHFMSHEDFTKHEKENPSRGERYEPFPGYYSKIEQQQQKKSVQSPVLSKPKLGEKEYEKLPLSFEGEKNESTGLDVTEFCGVWEIDRLFLLDLEETPSYSDKDFYADYETFSVKCKEVAESDISVKKKEIWIVRILNVLTTSFCFFSSTEKNNLVKYVISYAAQLDAAFMKTPEQICVKRIAQELGDPIIFREMPPDETIMDEQFRQEFYLDSRPWEETAMFEELGTALVFHQRRMCRDCSITNCPFRFGTKRYYADVDYSFGNPNYIVPHSEPMEGFESDDTADEQDQPVESYIDDCIRYFTDPEITHFLDAVCLSLSIPPKWVDKEMSIEEKKVFIEKYIAPRKSYYYRDSHLLASELTDAFRSLKDDPIELSIYIGGFLSQFYELSIALHPVGMAETDYLRGILFTCASGLVKCPFIEFPRILSESFEAIIPRHEYEDKESHLDLIKEVLKRAPGNGDIPKDRIFAAIHEIKTSLNLVEAALEAALLTAGIKQDYIYFEEEAGVNLGRWISAAELYIVTQRSPQFFVSRIKQLEHRTRLGIRANEDMYDYIKRVFSEKDEMEPQEQEIGSSNNVSHVEEEMHPEQDSKARNDEPSDFVENKPSDFIIPDDMQVLLDKAKHYFPEGRWWNNDRRQYAIFMKALYCKVYDKEWTNNVRWVDLPNFPLKDGTTLTVVQIKTAIRNYNDKKDGKFRLTFENLFKKN